MAEIQKVKHTSLRIRYILSLRKHKKVSTFHVELAVIDNFENSKKGNGKEAKFIDINVLKCMLFVKGGLVGTLVAK